MLAAWTADHPGRTIDEQRLAGQRLKIVQGGFLSSEEMDLVRRQATGEASQTHNDTANDAMANNVSEPEQQLTVANGLNNANE